MARQTTFTVNAEKVQGNEGATVTFKCVKRRDWKAYMGNDDINDIVMIENHLVDWHGFTDDDGNELPSPKDEPGILDELYLHEQRRIARLLWQGPDGEDAIKN